MDIGEVTNLASETEQRQLRGHWRGYKPRQRDGTETITFTYVEPGRLGYRTYRAWDQKRSEAGAVRIPHLPGLGAIRLNPLASRVLGFRRSVHSKICMRRGGVGLQKLLVRFLSSYPPRLDLLGASSDALRVNRDALA